MSDMQTGKALLAKLEEIEAWVDDAIGETVNRRVEDSLLKAQKAIKEAKDKVISNTPKRLWDDDKVQFARLVSELEGGGAFDDDMLIHLNVSMDLTNDDIFNIVNRAAKVFEASIAKVQHADAKVHGS